MKKIFCLILLVTLIMISGCDSRDLNAEVNYCIATPDTLFVNSEEDIFNKSFDIILNVIDSSSLTLISKYPVEYEVLFGHINELVYTDSLGIARNEYYPLYANIEDSLVNLPVTIKTGDNVIVKYVTLMFDIK